MAETFEMKWASFLDYLTKQKTTLAVGDLEAIRKALVAAKFDQVCLITKKKRLNGYNLYMKQRMSDLKEEVPDSNKRMIRVSEEWHTLPEDQQGGWKEKAKEKVSETPVQIKVKKPRKSQKLSGYQLFVRENMSLVKDVTPRQKMVEIGKLWKALSEDARAEYVARATEIVTRATEVTPEVAA